MAMNSSCQKPNLLKPTFLEYIEAIYLLSETVCAAYCQIWKAWDLMAELIRMKAILSSTMILRETPTNQMVHFQLRNINFDLRKVIEVKISPNPNSNLKAFVG